MKNFAKILIISVIILLTAGRHAFCETKRIPLRITPAKLITTKKDKIEVGDILEFKATSDVYKNDKVYIKKDTPVYGFVDFVHPNGWAGDYAEIVIRDFKTHDVSGKNFTIKQKLTISGNKDRNNDIRGIFIYAGIIGWIFRGAEVNLDPDKIVFNLFIYQ